MKLAVLVAFTVLAIVSPALAAEPQPVTGERLDAVQNAVRAQLRDPGSANFDSVLAVQKGAGEIVCGMVNAKNGFGGYAGFAPFSGVLVKRGERYLFEWVKLDEPKAVIARCASSGIQL